MFGEIDKYNLWTWPVPLVIEWLSKQYALLAYIVYY